MTMFRRMNSPGFFAFYVGLHLSIVIIERNTGTILLTIVISFSLSVAHFDKKNETVIQEIPRIIKNCLFSLRVQ